MFDRILNTPILLLEKLDQIIYLVILQCLKTYDEDLRMALTVFHGALQQGMKNFEETRDEIAKNYLLTL